VEESAVPQQREDFPQRKKRSEGSERQGVRRLSQPRLRSAIPGVFGPRQDFALHPAVDTASHRKRKWRSTVWERQGQQETFATQDYDRSPAASSAAGRVLLSTRRWRCHRLVKRAKSASDSRPQEKGRSFREERRRHFQELSLTGRIMPHSSAIYKNDFVEDL
jgi:hypothetical protein